MAAGGGGVDRKLAFQMSSGQRGCFLVFQKWVCAGTGAPPPAHSLDLQIVGGVNVKDRGL